MKVIGIVGSPRRNGNTEALTKHALQPVEAEGIDTELIRLADIEIKPCNACMVCLKEENCPIKDDLLPVYEKMKEAQGIILASPVYFGSATPQIKALMDRSGYLARHNKNAFSGKVGGPLVVARRAGQVFTFIQLLLWFMINGMIVPGSTYWNVAFGRNKGEVESDTEGMRTVANFGQNIGRLVKKLF